MSDSLKQYLAKRKIDEHLAGRYCGEVNFTLYGKSHVAIGFPNNSGGYELRNEYFKGSTSPKDITLVDQGQGRVSVFEGFFSFLSYLQLGGRCVQPKTNFLILNSLSLIGRATALLEQHRRIDLYLDRDEAGVQATRKILTTGLQYRDKSNLYRNYKDLNELLMQHGRIRTSALRPGR